MSHVLLLMFTATLLYVGTAVAGEDYYCRFTPYHTLCRHRGVSKTCGRVFSRGVSSTDQWKIVDAHNRLRASVARGETNQPPASNMMQLEWDNELAYIAQRWADQCKFTHDCSNCRTVSRFRVGQNLYISYFSRLDYINWDEAIRAWGEKEIRLFSPYNVSPFRYVRGAGHYTQMVWGETTKVGCGLTTYNNSGNTVARLYVCNYGKGGNLIGGRMYDQGQSCTRCPAYSACSASYPGLCSAYTTYANPRSGRSVESDEDEEN